VILSIFTINPHSFLFYFNFIPLGLIGVRVCAQSHVSVLLVCHMYIRCPPTFQTEQLVLSPSFLNSVSSPHNNSSSLKTTTLMSIVFMISPYFLCLWGITAHSLLYSCLDQWIHSQYDHANAHISLFSHILILIRHNCVNCFMVTLNHDDNILSFYNTQELFVSSRKPHYHTFDMFPLCFLHLHSLH